MPCGRDLQGTCVCWASRFRSRQPPAGGRGSLEVRWGTVLPLGAGDPAGHRSEARAHLLSPTAQGKAGPVLCVTEAASAASRWGRAQASAVHQTPPTEPRRLGGAGSSRAVPLECGERSVPPPPPRDGSSVTGSVGRPERLCLL